MSSKLNKIEDKQLIKETIAGNSDSFKVLVNKYSNALFKIALGVMKNTHDAEEVLQESFVKIFLNLNKFKFESTFYTWARRIVFNMSIDTLRKKKRRGGDHLEYQDAFKNKASNESTVEQKLELNEELQTLKLALSKLSKDHREVIELREIQELDYKEIAKILNVNKGTIMSRLFYGRKKLVEILSKNEEMNKNFVGNVINEE